NQRGYRANPRARLQPALRIGAIVHDLATKFVTEHDIARKVHWFSARKKSGQFDHATGVLARVQVRAADAAGQCPDQHLAGAGYRLWHGIDDDLAVPENGSAHGFPSVSSHAS